MPASKSSTARRSADIRVHSDLARVDAHVVQPNEYDELPELTDEMMARAVRGSDPARIRRGRPRLDAPKRQVNIRLDADLLDRLRASGPGWQGRVNAALRAWVEADASGADQR